MGIGKFFKKAAKVAATPITYPTKLIKKGAHNTMTAILLGLVRHALTAAGGALVANGTLGGSDVEASIGAIITLVGIGASVWSKKKPA